MQQCEMKWAAANWMTAIVSKYFLYNFIDTIYILAKRKIRMPLVILEMEMTMKRDSTQQKSARILHVYKWHRKILHKKMSNHIDQSDKQAA